jgi:hypothetical protein
VNSIYDSHVKQLTVIATGNHPVVSIYVPLAGFEMPPGTIRGALRVAANRLLAKDGYPSHEGFTIDWYRWQQQGAATLGIFIGGGITMVIPLPLRLPPRVVVATSFHVKPLVAAAECDVGALLVHFSEIGAAVYHVTSAQDVLLETYLPAPAKARVDWAGLGRQAKRDFLEFLVDEVRGLRPAGVCFLGVSSAADSLLSSPEVWQRLGLELIDAPENPRAQIPQNAISILRLRVGRIINDRYRRRVSEIVADATVDALGDVVPLILKGKINRLCVSLEDMQFGILDPVQGNIFRRKSQTDCRDDDVLDDLLELAMRNDVQVSVVPKAFLPPGRSFVAS